MNIALTGCPRTPKYVPPTIPYEIQHILGSAGKVAGKVAGGRPTRPGATAAGHHGVVPTYEVTPHPTAMAHTHLLVPKGPWVLCVPRGGGGEGSPLYMQFGLFPFCHEQTYFFLKCQLNVEGSRERHRSNFRAIFCRDPWHNTKR